jgi:hypothetical protein
LCLRNVKRYTRSNWLLIIAFLCLGFYLFFPSFFNPLSSALFSEGIGKHASLSYSVSRPITSPSIINLNITVVNNDIIEHNYAVVALIGNNNQGVWWGPEFYRDNLTPSAEVQNVPSQWWNQSYIGTGLLKPGQSFQIERKIEIANDSLVNDANVLVFSVQDGSHQLAQLVKRDIIHVR